MAMYLTIAHNLNTKVFYHYWLPCQPNLSIGSVLRTVASFKLFNPV